MRDREETRAKILEAVGKILAEEGFQGIGINNVSRRAGVDKVLIYRYFGDLPGLLREFASSGDYWPSMKALIERPEGMEEERFERAPRREYGDRPERGDRGPRRDRGDRADRGERAERPPRGEQGAAPGAADAPAEQQQQQQ